METRYIIPEASTVQVEIYTYLSKSKFSARHGFCEVYTLRNTIYHIGMTKSDGIRSQGRMPSVMIFSSEQEFRKLFRPFG